MKCILLCAGYATRLYPITKNFPKALLEIEDGKPLLDYIYDEVLTISEVDEIFIITNECFYSHFSNWASSKVGKKVTVVNDHTTSNEDRLGAIGDILYTIQNQKIEDDLLIIAGDNLFDYHLSDVINYYHNKKESVVCAKKIEDKKLLQRLAVAKVDETNCLINLVEKPEIPESDLAVYATYVYPQKIISILEQYLNEGNKPDAPGYFVEYLYHKSPVYVYEFNGNCYDVGTIDALNEVRTLYQNKYQKRI